MDVSAEKMIFGVSGVDPQRREELIKVCLLFLLSYYHLKVSHILKILPDSKMF